MTFRFRFLLFFQFSVGMDRLNIGHFFFFLIEMMHSQSIAIFWIILRDRRLCSNFRMASFFFVLDSN